MGWMDSSSFTLRIASLISTVAPQHRVSDPSSSGQNFQSSEVEDRGITAPV